MGCGCGKNRGGSSSRKPVRKNVPTGTNNKTPPKVRSNDAFVNRLAEIKRQRSLRNRE
jgi:hypothetical protein